MDEAKSELVRIIMLALAIVISSVFAIRSAQAVTPPDAKAPSAVESNRPTYRTIVAARPMPDLMKLAARSRPTREFGRSDAQEAFWDILKLRDSGDQNAVPVLAKILVSNAGSGRIHGYAAAQALFCIGGKDAIAVLDSHLFRLDEYNENLASLYAFHWDMPEPKRSQFIEQYLLKGIGHDIELTLDAKPEDGGRSVRFRLTLTNVSTTPLDVIVPVIHKLYLLAADGQFLPWHATGVREYGLDAKLTHLKPNESRTVEATGEIKPSEDFEPYQRKLANNAQAMLKLGVDCCFIDKPGQFQGVFVLEQAPIAANQSERLKLENRWTGRAVSSPVAIALGQPAKSAALPTAQPDDKAQQAHDP